MHEVIRRVTARNHVARADMCRSRRAGDGIRAGLAVVTMLAALGCGRATVPSHPIALRIPSSPPPLVGGTVNTRLEQRADGIHLVTEDATTDALVAAVAPHEACVVEAIRPRSHSWTSDESVVDTLVCPGVAARIDVRDFEVRFGPRVVALPGQATIPYGVVPRSPAVACPAEAVGPTIVVAPRYAYVDGYIDVELAIPALSAVVEVGYGGRLQSHRLSAAKTLVMSVGSVGGGRRRELEVRHQGPLLLARRSTTGINGNQPLHTVAAYWLPCGARVEFTKVNHRVPGWVPLGGDCPQCTAAWDQCVDPCFDHMTDRDGVFTIAGVACEQACRTKYDACTKACGLT